LGIAKGVQGSKNLRSAFILISLTLGQ